MVHLQTTRSRLAGVLLLTAVAGLGVAGAIAARHDAISGNPDAIVYVEAGDNLLAGRGLSAIERHYTASPLRPFQDEPLTHYPPLLPLLIAGVGACGVAPEQAAQGINIFLLGASILLAGGVTYRAGGGSVGAAFAAGAMLLASPTTLWLHTEAVSEPVFVFLALASRAVLAEYLDRRRWALLAWAAGLAGLAWMARYVGVALVATGAIALLLRPGAPVRRRLAEALGFAAIAAGPMAGWVVRNRLVAGTATHRPIAFHPIPPAAWAEGWKTLRHWFLPHGTPPALAIVALCVMGIAIVAVGVAMWRRRRTGGTERLFRTPRLIVVMGLFAGTYLATMVFSMTFVDALTPFDSRTLYPLYACAVVAGAAATARLYRAGVRRERLLLACSACAVLVVGGLAAGRWVLESRRDGLAAPRSWMHSEAMRAVAGLAPEAPIYTNAGMAVHFQTGRRAFGLPVKSEPLSGSPNPRYELEWQALREGLSRPGSVLVLLPNIPFRYYPTQAELRALPGLVVVLEEPRGVILRMRRP